MMDVILGNKLVKAIPAGAHLLLSATSTSAPRSAPTKYCDLLRAAANSRGYA
jgi:hypothetical protein